MKRNINAKCFTQGFTLVEISIVLLIMAVMALGYSRSLKDSNQDDKSAAIAAHLKAVTGGVNTYISSNFDALIAGTNISGIAVDLAPTVTELKSTGYLAQNIKNTNLAGTSWLIQIQKTPAGCVAPACDLNAIVYSNKGFIQTSTGNPDWMLAARVAGAVGGDGGTSLTSNTATISGVGGAWTTPNPVVVANAKAVVAMRTGYGSQGFSQFVRNGDTRDITLNGNLAVNGATGVSTTKLSTTKGVTVGTTLKVTGVSTLSGGVNVGGTGVNTNTLVTSSAQITGVTSSGLACSPDGSIMQDGSGWPLFCQNGYWVQPAPCNGTFCNVTHGTLTATCSPYWWTVPAGVNSVEFSANGGNGGKYDSAGNFGGGGGAGAYASDYLDSFYTTPGLGNLFVVGGGGGGTNGSIIGGTGADLDNLMATGGGGGGAGATGGSGMGGNGGNSTGIGSGVGGMEPNDGVKGKTAFGCTGGGGGKGLTNSVDGGDGSTCGNGGGGGGWGGGGGGTAGSAGGNSSAGGGAGSSYVNPIVNPVFHNLVSGIAGHYILLIGGIGGAGDSAPSSWGGCGSVTITW